jgi:hypothetical protein
MDILNDLPSLLLQKYSTVKVEGGYLNFNRKGNFLFVTDEPNPSLLADRATASRLRQLVDFEDTEDNVSLEVNLSDHVLDYKLFSPDDKVELPLKYDFTVDAFVQVKNFKTFGTGYVTGTGTEYPEIEIYTSTPDEEVIYLRTGFNRPGTSNMYFEVAVYFTGTAFYDVTTRKSESEYWVQKVRTKWSPPPGTFTKDPKTIADVIAKASKSLAQAVARVNFYYARKGCSGKRKDDPECKKWPKVLSHVRKYFK